MAYNNATNTNVTGIVNADGAGAFNGSNLDATGNTISSTDTNGNVILSPNGTGIVSLTKGLSFDSGTNTIADYEAGSFTPTLNFGGASVGITYGTQTGTYIRIGSFVMINVNVTITNKGSSTGIAQITGLSLTPSATFKAHVNHSSITYAGDDLTAIIRDSGGFNVLFQGSDFGTTGTNLTNTAFANTTSVQFTGMFTV